MTNSRFALPAEIASWNHHILANPDGGSMFQSYEFAEHKAITGWRSRYVFVGEVAVSILEKSVPLLGKLWYIPKGPGVTSARELKQLLRGLTEFATKQGVFLIKLEPELIQTDETVADLLKLHLLRAPRIQPGSTVLVDLSPPLETILQNFHQKGRHAVNRAIRDGVTAELVPCSEENCQRMYELFKETAAGSFPIRSYNYYKEFWQSFEKSGSGQLFFAYDTDHQLVAGAYAIAYGQKSTYKDGASVRQRTTYGASHLLQWKVMQWAKAKGSLMHDLCGTPPSSAITDPTHPFYGLGRFKTSFNKTVTDYVGVYDLPLNPTRYTLWKKILSKVVHRLHFYLRKESYY